MQTRTAWSTAAAFVISFALLGCSGEGDRTTSNGVRASVRPQAVATSRWIRFPLLPDGRFPIAGWLSPLIAQSNDARYAEYAAAGFTVVLPTFEDPLLETTNRQRLDLASRHGLYVLVRDDRVHPDEATRSGWKGRVDSMIVAYSSHPATLGYFLADEPNSATWPSLAALTAYFAERDRNHPTYINMLGQSVAGGYDDMGYAAWLESFTDQVGPPFFSVDHYVLTNTAVRPQLCAGLDAAARAAGRLGIPFWSIVLITAHADFRTPTADELDWQANLSLAYGARGLVWFTYWTPRPDSWNYHDGPLTYEGARTPQYDHVMATNARVQALGQEMASLSWLEARHAGVLPQGGSPLSGDQWIHSVSGGDVAIGFFRDGRGRDHALIVNRDRERSVDAQVTAAQRMEIWSGAAGDYDPFAGTVTLGPGRAALIRSALAEGRPRAVGR